MCTPRRPGSCARSATRCSPCRKLVGPAPGRQGYPPGTMRDLHVRRLGLLEYEDGLRAQRLLGEARVAGTVPDTLLVLEHPRVVTLGRGAEAGNILWSRQMLQDRGFEVFETARGGDRTSQRPR